MTPETTAGNRGIRAVSRQPGPRGQNLYPAELVVRSEQRRYDRWRDVEGTPIPEGCRVRQVGVHRPHGGSARCGDRPPVQPAISWELTGHTPPGHRLTFHVDDQARIDLEVEVFGKRVLITDREDWPIGEVVAGYRSQSKAEFGFRQLKDPHVVSFSPDAPLDRPPHPRPYLHLRAGPADRPPDAPPRC